MTASPSTQQINQDNELDNPKIYKSVLSGISWTLVFKGLALTVLTQPRIKLMLNICQGNSAKAALYLGRIRAVGALSEFMVGPLFGRLSDKFGRKSIMQTSMISGVLGNALIFMFPTSLTAHVVGNIPTIALDTAFFATMRASLSDVMSGKNIAENAFTSMLPAGIAMVMAPAIGGRLNPRAAYLFATVASLLGYFQVNNLKETLAMSKRMELDYSACNPFAFIRLFTGTGKDGRILRTLASISGIQTLTDSRLLLDVATLHMRTSLKWNTTTISKHLFFLRAFEMSGAFTAKSTVRNFGRIGHTHFSHVLKCVGYIVWSNATSKKSMRIAAVLLMFSFRQRDGVETMMTEYGVKEGMGKGQMEAYKMNFRSIFNLIGPLVYARCFALGSNSASNGMLGAGLPFSAAASFVGLAEMMLLTLPGGLV